MYVSLSRAHSRSAIFPVAALSAVSQLLAQNLDEHVVLDPFLVVANQRPQTVGDVPLPVSVVDASDLRSGTATLGEALAREPGVSSSFFGAGSSRPIIRGMGDQRVLITEGGLAAFDLSDTSPDHAVALEPLLAEKVRIVRGPASLLYGSSAVGGVVDVDAGEIPDAIPQAPVQGMIHSRAETGNEGFATAARVTSRALGSVFRLQGLFRETDDYVLPENFQHPLHDHDQEEHLPDEPLKRLPNSQVATRSIAAGWRTFLSGGTVGGAASLYRSEYGVPGHHAHHGHEHGEGDGGHFEEEDEAAIVRLARLRARFESSIDDPAPALGNLLLRFAWGDYWHEELHGDAVGARFDRESWETRLEALHTIMGMTGVVGLQASRSEQSSSGMEAFTPASDTRNYAIFAMAELNFRDSLLVAGLRLEHQDIGISSISSGYSDETASGALSIVHPMGEVWRLGASMSLTSRHPNATELFAAGPHAAIGLYELGDPTLRAETAYGPEVFIRRVSGPLTGALNIFYTSFQDYIFLQETEEQCAAMHVARFVAEDVTFYGAELDLQWELFEGLILITGGDVVRSKIRETNEPLPRTPSARSWFGLELSSSDWSLEGRWVHVFRQDRIAYSETETPGYDDLSIKVQRNFLDGDVGVYATLSNILDKVQIEHTSFLREQAPRPGRTLTIAATWTY